MSSPHPRLPVIDALRGIAAFCVCWYHFTNGNATFLPDGALRSSGSLGWLGVDMFFTISGFIIPYALFRSSYHTSDYGRFMLKRIIRLDPPYIVVILIVLALGYISNVIPGFRSSPFEVSLVQIALHLGYINVLFGYPWLSPVFWTLAIELQYYLLIGLLYYAVAHRLFIVRVCTFACLGALALLIPSKEFIFHWLFLFMLGMSAFQLRVNLIDRRQFVVWVMIIGLSAWHMYDIFIAMTGIVTALLLGLFKGNVNAPLLFFGRISYSLYLIHAPIGGRVVKLGERFVHTSSGRIAVLGLALSVSIAAAWLLYRYVERPAQEWSSRIHYTKWKISSVSADTKTSAHA